MSVDGALPIYDLQMTVMTTALVTTITIGSVVKTNLTFPSKSAMPLYQHVVFFTA